MLRGDLNGFLVSKITFESTFLFYFFEFYLLKKVTKLYKSISTSISRVFRVNQVFFSSRGPPFLQNCNYCGRLIHDRKMQNILRARFRSTVSPSNKARNARTQRRNEMHSMAADNEQKFHAVLSRERLITFLICNNNFILT